MALHEVTVKFLVDDEAARNSYTRVDDLGNVLGGRVLDWDINIEEMERNEVEADWAINSATLTQYYGRAT